MSDRPKLGATFRGQTGLEGRLRREPTPPTPPVARPEPAAEAAPAPTVAEPATAPTARTRPVAPRTPAATRAAAPSRPKAGTEPTRIVSVQLDVNTRERLRDLAARQNRTLGGVTLDAIEAHAAELATHWADAQAPPSTGLFPTTTRDRARTQVSAPTQLRMTHAAADVLDDLVAQWSAPSRSALVNEALRKYLTQQEAP